MHLESQTGVEIHINTHTRTLGVAGRNMKHVGGYLVITVFCCFTGKYKLVWSSAGHVTVRTEKGSEFVPAQSSLLTSLFQFPEVFCNL